MTRYTDRPVRIPYLVLLTTALLCAGPARPAGAEVHLTIHDGRVTLSASGATIREILAEWARVGRTRIVNGDKVPGGPVTLQLANEPEDRALETILRSASGYLAAPRAALVPDASIYDRIIVMPTSTPPRTAPPTTTVQQQQPTFQPAFQPPVFPGQPGFPPPVFNQPGVPPQMDFPADDQDGTISAPGGPGAPPNARGPLFGTFPPAQSGASQPPDATDAPGSQPSVFPAPGRGPAGVAVPGMIVQPPPPQRGQPAAPPGFPFPIPVQ